MSRRTSRFRPDVAICRPDRDHDRHVGHDRGNRGLDHDPCGDRAQHGRGLLPNTPHRNVRRRGAVQPSAPARTLAESNSLHATCSVFLPDTSNPPPTHIQELALRV